MNFTLLFLFFTAAPLIAIPQETNAISEQDVQQQISRSGPSEESPFLIEREEAQQALAKAATNGMNNPFPSRHSFQKQLGNFCTHLFRTLKAGNQSKQPITQLFIEPSTFSTTDTPELDITFKITNTKKEMIMLNFSTNQRIDILVKNAHGDVLTRWSEDRSFDPIPGLVAINPNESVTYTEKISTAMMHDGETYTIETSLADQPGYTLSKEVMPKVDVLDDESELGEQR